MNKLLCFIILILLFTSNLCFSEETEIYSQLNSSQKKEATELYNQVKCPTCNGQYIKESNTPSAKILRDEIAIQIMRGYNKDQITQNLISQFGEEIINRNSYSNSDLILWISPILFLILCFLGIWKRIKL